MKILGALVPTTAVLAVLAACAGDDVAGAPATSDAERIVNAMIEAHGGMERWSSAPTVRFETTLRAPGGPAQTSLETIEQGRRRAYIDYPGTEMRLCWDGERAWSENWNAPFPPRFVALLDYYFFNLPWLTRDPGVVLGEPGTGLLPDDPTEYVTVRMSFEPGVGDTPDDYYVLYVHPATKMLRATKYVVTYAELLPEGVPSTPENTFVYDEFESVDGLQVPTRATIYSPDGGVHFEIEVRGWSFGEPFDDGRMSMPAGAVVDTSDAS